PFAYINVADPHFVKPEKTTLERFRSIMCAAMFILSMTSFVEEPDAYYEVTDETEMQQWRLPFTLSSWKILDSQRGSVIQ
ncbi:unnamed protein product, partial [Allacma fusca]